jgi:hypothetical protein
MKNYSFRFRLTACLLVLFCVFCAETRAQRTSPAVHAALTSSADAAIPTAQLLQPAELMQILDASNSEKPLILQVGSHVFYAEAHILGSEYVGAGGQDAGLQAFRERVRDLEHSRFLVIYCGCCPWNKRPNIRPAYRAEACQDTWSSEVCHHRLVRQAQDPDCRAGVDDAGVPKPKEKNRLTRIGHSGATHQPAYVSNNIRQTNQAGVSGFVGKSGKIQDAFSRSTWRMLDCRNRSNLPSISWSSL